MEEELSDRLWRRVWRQVASAISLSIILAAVLSACVFDRSSASNPPVSASTPIFVRECEVLVPRTLPSGAAPGEPNPAGDGRFSWGFGADRVVEAVDEPGVGDPATQGVPRTSKQWVSIRGSPGLVIPVGDDGVGEITITWLAGECAYVVWLAPGHTLDEAIRYAGNF